MWTYEKRLQFPVRIARTCPKTARLIISQYGGPDGELSASLRYLSQRYTMPVKSVGNINNYFLCKVESFGEKNSY